VRSLLAILVLAGCGGDDPKTKKCKNFVDYFADADGDGYGDASSIQEACDGAPKGYVSDDTDCDDSAEDAYPGATEVYYDGIDQACDGLEDEWDQDGDGYTVGGGPDPSERLDCADTDPDIHPDVVVNGDDSAQTSLALPDAANPWIGAPGPELRLAPPEAGEQHHATVALGEDGTFLLAWQSGKFNTAEIFAQHFDLDGNELGNPIRMNDLADTGGKPDVEWDGSGYWLTWQDNEGSVFLRRLDTDGVPTGASVAVYESTYESEGPDVAPLADGNVAVVWNVDAIPDEQGRDYYRIYDVDSNPVTDVVTAAITGRSVADAAALTDGNFVLVGTNKDSPPEGLTAEVYGRVIGPDGCITQFRVDQGASDFPSRPAVAASPDGTFAVTWRNKVEQGVGDGVYGRFFAADGRALGDQVELMPLPNNGTRSVVGFVGTDAFFAWQAVRGDPFNDVSTVAIDSQTLEFSVPEYSQNTDEDVDHNRPAIALGTDAGEPIMVSVWEALVTDDRIILGRVTRFSR